MRQQWNDKRLSYKDRLHGVMAGREKVERLNSAVLRLVYYGGGCYVKEHLEIMRMIYIAGTVLC